MDSSSLAAIGQIVSATAAIITLFLARSIHRSQSNLSLKIFDREERLAQRQLLIPLWQYLSTVPEVISDNDGNYVEPNIIKAANTLELVALCCEGNIIDKQIIFRTFSSVYISIYDAILAVPKIRSRNGISGAQLLMENRSAMAFYNELKQRLLNSDRLENN